MPKTVNSVELVTLTASFFDDERSANFKDFAAEVEEFAVNRANVDELVCFIFL
jgi:hypothetical protein